MVDQTYALLGSFEIILANIHSMFLENYKNGKISEKKSKIINSCYQLILGNIKNYNIPIPILVKLIKFITMNTETKDSIIKFQQPAVFDAYLKSIII